MANTFYQSRLVTSSLSNYCFNHLSKQYQSSYSFEPQQSLCYWFSLGFYPPQCSLSIVVKIVCRAFQCGFTSSCYFEIMCFMPTSSTTLFQQQPQIFCLTLIGYYICLESSNHSSCSPIAHQYLPFSWRLRHRDNPSRLKSTVIFSLSFWDTSHVIHHQLHSVARVSSSAKFTFIYTRDCCIMRKPSSMSSSSGYLLALMPTSSIWRIFASCLSLHSCRCNTSTCLMPALVFHK